MKTRKKEKVLFGPVCSRRLGRSLGIDLLPFKTCSMDCIYCECGRTGHLVTERKEYYPLDSVFNELDMFFETGEAVDYVTFSGVGEPTLHTGIGKIVDYIKEKRPDLKVCLLTNGTELDHEDLQESLHRLDLIVPSLDASCETEFQQINRPAPGVSFEQLVKAVTLFRKNVPEPRMYLELFIVPGINDGEDSVARFREIIRQINPDRIQLNSLDRPGTEADIPIPSREHLVEMADRFRDIAAVDIISRKNAKLPDHITVGNVEELNAGIEKLLSEGVCDLAAMALKLNVPEIRLQEYLRRLVREGRIEQKHGKAYSLTEKQKKTVSDDFSA